MLDQQSGHFDWCPGSACRLLPDLEEVPAPPWPQLVSATSKVPLSSVVGLIAWWLRWQPSLGSNFSLQLRNCNLQRIIQPSKRLELVLYESGIIIVCTSQDLPTSVVLPALTSIKRGNYIKLSASLAHEHSVSGSCYDYFESVSLLALLMTVKPEKTSQRPFIWQRCINSLQKGTSQPREQWGALSQGFGAFCFIQPQSSFEPTSQAPYQGLWLWASVTFRIIKRFAT